MVCFRYRIKGVTRVEKDKFGRLAVGTLVRGVLYHVMCLLVSLGALAVVPGVWGAVVAQAACLVIVTVFPYRTFYQVGFRDCNKIRYGHGKHDPLKGAKAALLGYLPFLLASAAFLLARVGVLPDGLLPYYRLVNAPFLGLMQSFLPTALTFAEVPLWQVIGVALTSLILPVASGLGYAFGLARVPAPFAKKKPDTP